MIIASGATVPGRCEATARHMILREAAAPGLCSAGRGAMRRVNDGRRGFSGRHARDLAVPGRRGFAVPVFSRLRVSPVLAFLLAGVILGPCGLGTLADLARRFPMPALQASSWLERILSSLAITDSARIGTMADLGVVFLLFMVGLELSFQRLSRMRRLDTIEWQLVVAATFSMMIVPVLARLGERLARVRKPDTTEAFEPPPRAARARPSSSISGCRWVMSSPPSMPSATSSANC